MTDDFTETVGKALLGDDELGAVVRAHLYIENVLDQLLEVLLEKPSHLANMNLSYANKVHLACAAGLVPTYKPMLLALGRIRNTFSHNLNAQVDAAMVKDLHSAVDDQTRLKVPEIFSRVSGVGKGTAFQNMQPGDQFMALVMGLWVVLHNALREAEILKGVNGACEHG